MPHRPAALASRLPAASPACGVERKHDSKHTHQIRKMHPENAGMTTGDGVPSCITPLSPSSPSPPPFASTALSVCQEIGSISIDMVALHRQVLVSALDGTLMLPFCRRAGIYHLT